MDIPKLESYMETFMTRGVEYAPKVMLAVVTLLLGLWVIRLLTRVLDHRLLAKAVDPSLRTFLSGTIGGVLRVLLVLSAASMIGVETTSFLAALGTAGLAVGLALQGSLANIAGGVLILFLRPFRVGHLIEAGDRTGFVKAIGLFTTTVETPDLKTVIIPNGQLSGGVIVNYDERGVRRVDLVIGIAYGADLHEARRVCMKVMEEHPLVRKDPAPEVNVLALADSAVELAVRPFVNPKDYWRVYFEVTEQVKLSFDAAGIEIPFPQRVVHMPTPNR